MDVKFKVWNGEKLETVNARRCSAVSREHVTSLI